MSGRGRGWGRLTKALLYHKKAPTLITTVDSMLDVEALRDLDIHLSTILTVQRNYRPERSAVLFAIMV